MGISGASDVRDVATAAELRSELSKMKARGARFMMIIADDLGDGTLVLMYPLDLGGKQTFLRRKVPIDDELGTVSDIYPSAMAFEAELVDLFGLKFKGIPANIYFEKDIGVESPLRKSPRPAKGAGK